MNGDPDGGVVDVLAVTADTSFAAGIEEHLSGPGIRVRVVGSVGGAIDYLAGEGRVDCVVSDHDLPDTDGIAFLRTVRAQAPTLPFVLFTAEGSEEVASSAISADVTEYLVKERDGLQWDRLAALVEDAVAYRRNHGDFGDPAERARTLLDAVQDTTVVVRNGTIAFLNAPGADLFGFDVRSAAVGRPVDEFLNRASDDPFVDRIEDVAAGDRALDRTETTLLRADGLSSPVEVTATHIEWNGDPAAFLAVRDVSEHREHRAALRRFRRAVEAAGHAVYLTDPDGTITYVNPAFEEITGYGAEEAIGRTPEILSSGEQSEEYYEDLWTTLAEGELWEEEIVNRRRSGERYHAHQTIAPVRDDDGAIERFVAIQTDVTDRNETRRELERYREIVQRLEDPIMLQDCEGRFQLLNEAVVDYAGHTHEDLLGEDESTFMDEDAADEIESRKESVIASEESIGYEVSPAFERTDRAATFSTRRYPYYDPDGDLGGTIAICRNVTELKRREEELRQYERAIGGATDLIAAVDRDQRYLFANPQYRRYHGIGEGADVTDYALEDILDVEEYEAIRPRVERALSGETVRYRTERIHSTLGERTFDVRYYPLRHGEAITGVVGVLRDVTDREDRARQLRVVDRVLRHNLRNDLTVIRGIAEGIAAGTSGQLRTDATEIGDHVDRLLTTSEKSRNITEVLSDEPRHRTIDLQETVDSVADEAAEAWPNARIEVETPEGALATATQHVYDAVEELAANAVEHNDRESPFVGLRITRVGDAVRLHVADDGPTIPEMDREVLETGREIDDLYHGSGLGLWMVYWIVQRSGGSVVVHDSEPRGNEVVLEFPAADG